MKNLFLIIVFSVFVQNANAAWQHIDIPGNQSLNKGVFPDAMTGFVTGTNATKLWRTLDGGASWDSASFSAQIADIHFIDADTGYVLTGFGSTQSLSITHNSGDTWNTFTLTLGVNYFSAVFFVNSLKGILLSSDNVVYVTSDGGATWVPVTSDYIMYTDKEYMQGDTIIFTGWDGTFAYRGAVLRSYNAGISWEFFTPDSNYTTFNGSGFIDGMNGYAVSNPGWGTYSALLLKSTNGGEDWQYLYGTNNISFEDVFMINHQYGYICGYDSVGNGFILKSTDGVSWLSDETEPNSLNKFYKGGNTLFVIGDNGVVMKNDNLNSVDELTSSKVNIYPNPANDYFRVDNENACELKMYSMDGKCVMNRMLQANGVVYTNGMTPGIYMISIVDESGKRYGRIVIE
jgi:photosystem II stability/assembly factor-like uncharacterized protein